MQFISKANRLSGLVPKTITVTNTKTGTTYQKIVWIKPISGNTFTTESKNLSPNEQVTAVGNTVTHYPSGHQISSYVKGDIVTFTDTQGNVATGTVMAQIKTSQNVKSAPQLSILMNGKRFTVSEKRITGVVQSASTTYNYQFTNFSVGNQGASPQSTLSNTGVDGFPLDITKLKTLKSLGGSTGAMLVENNDGVQFVMKKGKNAEHIQEEFLAGQLYKAMGFDVPEAKLYNTDTQLTKYIDNITAYDNANTKQFKTMRNSFVAHCLLANWDISQNTDNVMVDAKGKLFFVDNGGSLRKRARGNDKGKAFGDDVAELLTIPSHNPNVFGGISDSSIDSQIQKYVIPNKAKILGIIQNSGVKNASALEKTMQNRIKYLEDFVLGRTKANSPNKNNLNFVQYDNSGITKFVDTRVNNEYSPIKVADLLDKMNIAMSVLKNPAKAYSDAMFGNEGFALLSVISEMRGFDAKPIVVSDSDFDKIANEPNVNVAYRSVQLTDTKYGNSLCAEEKTFWGGVGGSAYGSGIYFAMQEKADHGIVSPPPVTNAYNDSRGYVTSGNGHTHKVVVDTNYLIVADHKKLCIELSSLSKKVDAQMAKINKIRNDAKQQIQALTNKGDVRGAYDAKRQVVIDIRAIKASVGASEDDNFIAHFGFTNYDKAENFSESDIAMNYGSHFVGHYAMYKGYDAIVGNKNKSYSYLVVLNRSKLVVQESSALP